MKKKYLIEIGETNNKAAECFIKDNYPGSGFYLNTDESVIKALILVPKKTENQAIGLYDWGPIENKEIESLLGESLKEFPETDLEPIQGSTLAGIDGDTLIKAIAVAQNPELIKDIL